MRNVFLFLVLFFFVASCGSHKVIDYKSNNLSIDSLSPTSNLDSFISPYKNVLDEQMNEVIGEAIFNLEKYDPESPLSNFAAEAIFKAGLSYGNSTMDIGAEQMQKSFCLLNFGGLRAPINKGEITVGNIFELMPFDNSITLVKLSGEKMKELAYYLYESHGQPVANARFKLSSDKQTMEIGGEAYSFDEEVVVITSDYLAQGGDKMNFFNDPIYKWDSGILLRDVFIKYIRTQKELGAFEADGRIQFIK